MDSSWLIWLLGGTVEIKKLDDGSTCPPCTQAPTHAWNEIELPHSKCYLMLGGQTSAFRDRGFHAFRLVLHDTTFRWWEREQGKLTYAGLLLHSATPLSHRHVELLKRLIEHGDRQDLLSADGSATSPGGQFERSLDQDADLSPIFLEFPPASFVFQDDALAGMIAAYAGVFALYRRFAPFFKPAVNCVVVALLFGRSPKELLSLVPRETHEAVRAHARRLNDLWTREIGPILGEASRVFEPTVDVPLPQPWWRSWWPALAEPRTRPVTLSFEQQISRFRPAYLSRVMLPLKRALTGYSPRLAAPWARKFALADELLEYRLDSFAALRNLTSEGCEAESAVDQLLFCPHWESTAYWKRAKRSLSGASVVRETSTAVRSLLYWNAVGEVRDPA